QRTADHPGYWVETESNFYQTATASYRLKDRLKRERVTLEHNGTRQVISDKRYQWKVRTYHDDIDASYNVASSPHYFPYVFESSDQSWDKDGAPLTDSRSTNYRPAIYSCDQLSEAQLSDQLSSDLVVTV